MLHKFLPLLTPTLVTALATACSVGPATEAAHDIAADGATAAVAQDEGADFVSPDAFETDDSLEDVDLSAGTLTVVGVAETEMPADGAILTLSISPISDPCSCSGTPASGDEYESSMTAVRNALQALGVDPDEINVGSTIYSPYYSDLSVTLRDPSLVTEAVNAAREALSDIGGYNINNAHAQGFLEDCPQAEADAMEQAVAEAQLKAQALASLLTLELGDIRGVVERGPSSELDAYSSPSARRCSTPGEPGGYRSWYGGDWDEVIVTAAVEVIYEIERP